MANLARLTSIEVKDNDGKVIGAYEWNGATWFYAGSRPALDLDPKADLSRIGRPCGIRTDLAEEDLTRILEGYKINRADWLHDIRRVKLTSPADLESKECLGHRTDTAAVR